MSLKFKNYKKTVLISSLFFSILSSLSLYSQSTKIKKVNNVKEFFFALDDNVEIIIEADTLDFTLEHIISEINIKIPETRILDSIYKERKNKTYYIENERIVLYGYNNLKIKAPQNTSIISKDGADDILTFKNCKNITLENISIYHTPEACNGLVLTLMFSENINIKNCSLNGSGSIGVYLIDAKNVTFTSVSIFNNVLNAITTINSKKIKFINSEIYRNHAWDNILINTHFSELYFENCSFVLNEAEKLYNNNEEIDEYLYLLEEEGYYKYHNIQDELKYYPNDFQEFEPNLDISPFVPIFNNCVFSENIFKTPEEKEVKSLHNDSVKKQIFLELFFEIFVSEFNLGHYNEFSGYELASFLAKENIFLMGKKEKKQDDFNRFFYNYKSNSGNTLFKSVEITEQETNVFLAEIQADKDGEIFDIKWLIEFDQNEKINVLKEL